MRLRGKQVLVFGLGQYPQGSGVAAALWLAEQGARVTVTDLKAAERMPLTVAQLRGKRRITLVLGKHRTADFARAELIVRNPGVPWSSPLLALARRRGIPVHSDVTLFLEACPAPVAAITGTRGKSTSAALAAAMLAASGFRTWLGGNIRVSPLTFLEKVRPAHRVVLELSSFLTETLGPGRRAPEVAAITNLMRDHLNFYPGMRAYAAAKERIFAFQDEDGVAVVNRDDPRTRKMGERVPGRRRWWSVRPFPEENGGFLRGSRLVVRQDGEERVVADLRTMRLAGAHNRANAVVAALTALAAGATDAGVRKALRAFRGLPDRQETVAVRRGVRYVNDTTATTPDALLAALVAFGDKRHLILIAGGTDKRLGFAALPAAVRSAVKLLILLPGTGTDKMKKAFFRARLRTPAFEADSMDAAVALAAGVAERGDVVLLSPGCASFGLFANEFDRGERFVAAIRRVSSRTQ